MVHQHFTLVPAMTVAENVALGGHGGFDPDAAAARVRDVAAHAGLALDPHARVDALPVGRAAALRNREGARARRAAAHSRRTHGRARPSRIGGAAGVGAASRRCRQCGGAHHAQAARCARGGRRHHGAAQGAHRACRRGIRHERSAAGGGDARGRARNCGRSGSGSSTRGNRPRGGAGPRCRTCPGAMRAAWCACAPHRSRCRPVRSWALPRWKAPDSTSCCGCWRDGWSPHGPHQRPSRVGFVPEDRHRDALLLDAPLFENTALRGCRTHVAGASTWRTLRENTASLLRRFDVRAPVRPPSRARCRGATSRSSCSGASWPTQPQALVVENPSRGLDFKATAAVQHALREARDAGTAVVVYSSDLDEVLHARRSRVRDARWRAARGAGGGGAGDAGWDGHGRNAGSTNSGTVPKLEQRKLERRKLEQREHTSGGQT
jgi:hypothetical protein